MKHSGLAAELHVVHWSFLVDTEGKEGEEEESRQSPQQHLTLRVWAQPSPSSPNRLPAVPSCPRMQGHLPWLPGSTCPMCGPDEHLHLAEGQRPGLRPSPALSRWKAAEHPADKPLSGWDCGQVTNCSPHTCPGTPTSPLSPPPPPNSKEQNKSHLSGLFTLNTGKTLTNVTNAK